MVQEQVQTSNQETPKKGKFRPILKWVLITFMVLILIITGILSYGIKIDLNAHRNGINQWLTTALDRKTSIDGNMTLTVSFHPEIELNKVTIANLNAMKWQPMLTSGHIAAKISVLPLLTHELKIDYLNLKDISLHLLKTQDGTENWGFLSDSSKKNNADSSTPFKLALSNNIQAENISIDYQDQATGTYYNGFLQQLDLTKPNNWQLAAKGYAMGEEYNLSISGDLQSIINNQRGKFIAKGRFAGAVVNIAGKLKPLNESNKSIANVNLNWTNTAPLKSLLGIDLKHVAPLSLTTQLTFSDQGFSVNDLKIHSPISQATGSLNVKFGQKDKLNIINGDLDIPIIDLSPWLQPNKPKPRAGMMFAAMPQQSPLQKALNQWLIKTQSHIQLNIHKIEGLGTPVSNISLTVEGKNGILSAPMTANIANVALKGNASINATQLTSHVDISLGAKNSALGELGVWLSGIPNATGHLKDAELTMTTQGTKLKEWIDNSKLSVAINQATLNWGAKSSFAIDHAIIKSGMEQAFTSSISGSLMGIPVTIKAKQGTLSDIINNKNWAPSIQITSPVINVQAKGMLLGTRWQKGSWFNLDVYGKDVALLSPWLGTEASTHGEIQLKAKLLNDGDWIKFTAPMIQLMNTQGNLSMKWHPKTIKQFITFDSHFSTLDVNQISQLFAKKSVPKKKDAVIKQGVNLNIPILSHPVVIANSDIKLGVDKLLWAHQQINNIAFSGKVRDGKLLPSPFSANYADSLYKGEISFNINNTKISANLNLAVNKPNVGRILKQFNVVNHLPMTLNHAQLSIALSGRTLQELMEQAKIEAQLQGGTVSIADSYTGKAFNIVLNKGTFATGPNTATHLLLLGSAANKPVQIALNSLSLQQANDGRHTVPITLFANIGDIKLNAKSQVMLPIDMKRLNLDFTLITPNLDRFNHFIGIKLPPYGPITVKAALTTDNTGYHLRNMLVKVGSSELKGHGEFMPPLKGAVDQLPRINLVLNAPLIQIDDFKMGNWKAWLSKQSSKENKTSNTNKPVPILTPKGLSLFNANFKLNVAQVRSGTNWLGAGKLDWQLNNGKLTLNSLNISLPGGNINIDGSIKAQQNMFNIKLNGLVKNFNYGIIARRIDPSTDMRGNINLKFNLHSLAATPNNLMNNANGFIGFSVWPKNYQSNVIDLWAVSLAEAALPKFITHDNSVVNCLAGAFNVHNGNIKQRNLLLDTTRVQVHGTLNANYKHHDFYLYLHPVPKKAQIFSLQTPISVYGKFKHFSFDVPLSAILETSIRFTTSPVIAPLQWLFEKNIPANDSAECQRIWQQ